MRIKMIWEVLRESGEAWLDDRGARIGAAIAFFTTLSIAPILVIAIVIASLIYGEDAARGEISVALSGLVGMEEAKTIEGILAHSRAPRAGVLALTVSFIIMFIGATGVFVELQEALNDVWKVRAKSGRRVRTFLYDRFLSLVMVLGVGFLLLVSVVLTTALESLGQYTKAMFGSVVAFQAASMGLTFIVEVLLFGMIFKVLPYVSLAWRDVLSGALLTAFLFNAGKYLIGFYLAYSSVNSAYGAAGSLMALLIWIYYSVLAFVFGAEVTKVVAARAGRRISPIANAEVFP